MCVASALKTRIPHELAAVKKSGRFRRDTVGVAGVFAPDSGTVMPLPPIEVSDLHQVCTQLVRMSAVRCVPCRVAASSAA